MILRSLFFAGVLVLTPGCGRDSDAFLGSYVATGEVTLSVLGNELTQPYSDTVRIIEGKDSDILLVSEGGCSLPAKVSKDVATVVPNTACTQKLSRPDGTVLEATLLVKSGTVTRTDESLALNYSGTVSITYANRPYSGAFFSTAALTRSAAAMARAAGPVPPVR